ncbi:MAG: hypothetical protein IPG79_03350 [Saprospiraceae bacterium]|nr:hypothetical protein [Saprospiraceae bacterium]
MPALDIKEKLDYFSNKTFNWQKDYYNTYLPPDYNGELEYVLIDAGKHSNFKKGTWVYLYEKKIFNEKYHITNTLVLEQPKKSEKMKLL